jgi:hypothetical protein
MLTKFFADPAPGPWDWEYLILGKVKFKINHLKFFFLFIYNVWVSGKALPKESQSHLFLDPVHLCFQVCYSKAVLLANLCFVSFGDYLPLFCAQFNFCLQGSKCIHVVKVGGTVWSDVSLKASLSDNLSAEYLCYTPSFLSI